MSRDLEHKSRFLGYLRAGTRAREIKAGFTADLATGNGGAYALPKLLAEAIGRGISPAHALPALVSRGHASAPDYSEPMALTVPAYHWQGDTAVDAAPTITTVAPPVGGIVCETEIPRHLLHDAAYDLEQFLVASAVEAFAEAEAEVFVGGNGIRRPAGLVGAISLNATPDADLGIALRALRDSTPSQYRAHWLFPTVLADRLDGFAGFAPADNAGPARLHSIPVRVDEALVASDAASALVLLGDAGAAYRAVDIHPAGAVSPIEVQVDPFMRSGWVKITISKRVGGAVRNAAAISGFEVAL